VLSFGVTVVVNPRMSSLSSILTVSASIITDVPPILTSPVIVTFP